MCASFFYDILILNKSPKEHDTHWNLIINVLKEHILHLHIKKCLFAQAIVDFLGEQFLVEEVEANVRKVKV